MAFTFHHPVALSRCAPADRRLTPGALARRLAPRHATQRVLGVAHSKRRTHVKAAEDGRGKAATTDEEPGQAKIEGASTDLKVVYDRLVKLALPYWMDSEVKVQARWRLAAVVGLTIGTTGVSVLFNFLGRDFFNALSEKNAEVFTLQIFKYLGAFVIGIPVFVYRDYLQSKLALEWRQWMTEQYMDKYLQDRTFYRVQACSSVDNPDQRISSDIAQFTETQLLLVLRLLNAAIDLVSFSGILYSIYPPLFLALILYASGGTYVTLALGRPLIGLNFQQEAREADYRFGLVRLRENAESIAFYGGEAGERQLLRDRLGALVRNYAELLVSTRNLDFFTSFYRFLIQVLPAAVIAPLFFQGKIEFGVINQSQSAFNHILTDVSLVVYQFETLAGFTAVLDRLGQFAEVLEAKGKVQPEPGAPPPLLPPSSSIALHDRPVPAGAAPAGPPVPGTPLLELEEVSLWTPDLRSQLVAALNLKVAAGSSLLVEGPSGAGKTSLLRAVAGLWTSGSGTITRHGRCVGTDQGGTLFFVPQRPYMVLGTLRDQLLYPCWASAMSTPFAPAEESPSSGDAEEDAPGLRTVDLDAPVPDDAHLREVMQEMQLGRLLEGLDAKEESGNGLDRLDNWSAVLSLGEQQRLAMCRVLLVRPHLVLMDESTSAMDLENEALVYEALQQHSITAVSVGHRDSLRKYHSHRLRITPGASAASGANGCSWTLLTDPETDGEAGQQSTSALSQPASSSVRP